MWLGQVHDLSHICTYTPALLYTYARGIIRAEEMHADSSDYNSSTLNTNQCKAAFIGEQSKPT